MKWGRAFVGLVAAFFIAMFLWVLVAPSAEGQGLPVPLPTVTVTVPGPVRTVLERVPVEVQVPGPVVTVEKEVPGPTVTVTERVSEPGATVTETVTADPDLTPPSQAATVAPTPTSTPTPELAPTPPAVVREVPGPEREVRISVPKAIGIATVILIAGALIALIAVFIAYYSGRTDEERDNIKMLEQFRYDILRR